jgi:hypothetical protein
LAFEALVITDYASSEAEADWAAAMEVRDGNMARLSKLARAVSQLAGENPQQGSLLADFQGQCQAYRQAASLLPGPGRGGQSDLGRRDSRPQAVLSEIDNHSEDMAKRLAESFGSGAGLEVMWPRYSRVKSALDIERLSAMVTGLWGVSRQIENRQKLERVLETLARRQDKIAQFQKREARELAALETRRVTRVEAMESMGELSNQFSAMAYDFADAARSTIATGSMVLIIGLSIGLLLSLAISWALVRAAKEVF